MKKIPFIMVHKGCQDYLRASVSSIEKYHQLYLLGDEENRFACKEWYDISLLTSNYIEQFNSCYIHMSSNSEAFEKICFYRYIFIYEFACKNSIHEFIHCDSDIILLDECDEYLSKLRGYDAAYMIPEKQDGFRLTASPHFSYWTLETLKDFIEFIISTYKKNIFLLKEKYDYHQANDIPGGVCDMTLLYLFSKGRDNIKNIMTNDLFYLNYNISTLEYNSKDNRMLIFNHHYKIINNKLFFKDEMMLKKVLFLHMQGKAKKMIGYAVDKRYRMLFLTISILNLLRVIRSKIK